MRGRYSALSVLALCAGVGGGVFLERLYLNPSDMAGDGGPEILYWVAPMDANFRQPGPGKSPMGMDLIPVMAGQEPSSDPSEVMLSAAEINAIGVRTAIAQISDISGRIETVGFVGYDEHLTSHVHTRVDGWIEALNVRAVGDPVRKGDVLFEMFSQVIGSSSFDLLRAIEAGDKRIIDAARGKLRSHGMSDAQIARIEKSGEIARNIEVIATQNGVVTGLEAADGMFLQPGVRAVSLTDLSAVWLIVDVFERDIARMTDDMRAVATFEHLNGRTFEGVIDYVYPALDAQTRTLPVRLRFDNSEGLLRPNMFGNVSLIPNETRVALTVPTEAIIRNGAAERVILKTGEGTFKPRLITTGLRDSFGGGGRTEVVQGLAPGEEVVASAQFLIDSESALSAGLMRMAPTDEVPARGAGELVALDPETRIATIRHAALETLDWPAMTSRFALRSDIALDRLQVGQQVAFRAARGADGLLSLIELGSDDGIAATGRGKVLAVTADGKLTMEHDPIPELGWPAMQMDMDVAGIDVGDVTLDQPVEFDLTKGDDGLFTIVALRGDAMGGEAETPMAVKPDAMIPPIIVSGTIDAIDPATGMATITHGPMLEIGMPGMTMGFALDETLDAETLVMGTELTLTFARPDGMTMLLAAAEPVVPPMEVSGTINAIDSDTGMANITHGPMMEIGMPGMTMDFAVDPAVDPASLPVGEEVVLQLLRNPDFSMTLKGIAPAAQVGQ
ncbi:efflux RND transporter periplasmic adaptor subunit [Sulfitobacter guttiformis]|uniref:Cu(I)/Ag(I) efflux system membrane fusion protein n=1 Tax=Sulfitobacter guttiformis TaxID=74349 RepID=A0A420DH63_9RHOB|nr:efflux RND transporter periplasmic adaptor subunit [Sulfitobacter guttiformis]KIN72730.1 putative cation efflux system transmembrane protein [Sulfitobacter guttiformis KCTC 32187]RKE93556.1 Cu(I)/Ag(I) efflux system membrane fusion protein [Sulfitobacter guttiformis]